MEHVELDSRLSQLSTQWTMLFQARNGTPEEVDKALAMLMLRYSGAIHRYLFKAVGDPEVVEELDQEFALRFLQGKFLNFDPSRGRFRNYVKRAVRNLMIDYYRRKDSARHLNTSMETAIVEESGLEEFERQFLTSWRDELLDRTWKAMDDHERRTGEPYHKLLRFRVDHPELHSPQMAEQLSPLLGRSLTAGGVRQALLRARNKFAEILIHEVQVSLKSPTRDEIEEELGELKFLEYCQPVLKKLSSTEEQN